MIRYYHMFWVTLTIWWTCRPFARWFACNAISKIDLRIFHLRIAICHTSITTPVHWTAHLLLPLPLLLSWALLDRFATSSFPVRKSREFCLVGRGCNMWAHCMDGSECHLPSLCLKCKKSWWEQKSLPPLRTFCLCFHHVHYVHGVFDIFPWKPKDVSSTNASAFLEDIISLLGSVSCILCVAVFAAYTERRTMHIEESQTVGNAPPHILSWSCISYIS